MPAEWAPHAQCWMAWPCRPDTWDHAGAGSLARAREAYAQVAKAIADFEPVTMLARPADVAEASLMCGSDVHVRQAALSDSWVRDTGPTFLLDAGGRLAGVDWQFNAWGGLYEDYADDASVAARILERTGVRRFEAPLVFEGGSVTVDGEGTGIVVEECLRNPNRNPSLSKQQIEDLLKDYLGLDKLIWLARGLEDDETDGHVDEVACFVAPGRVAVLSAGDPKDENFTRLTAARALLKEETDAQGRPFDVVELPQPAPQRLPDGRRQILSYVNHYVANGAVIVPLFDDPADSDALELFTKLYPGREVVSVPGLDISVGGGCVHCITQQQPKSRDD